MELFLVLPVQEAFKFFFFFNLLTRIRSRFAHFFAHPCTTESSYVRAELGEVKAKIKNITSCSLRGAEPNGLGPRKLRRSLPT